MPDRATQTHRLTSLVRRATHLAAALLVAGCGAGGAHGQDAPALPAREPAMPEPAAQVADAPPLRGEEAEAIDAIRRKDYGAAHAILARLLFAEHLADARARLERAEASGALIDTGAALELFPEDPDALLVHARAMLMLAEQSFASGGTYTRQQLADALQAAVDAGASPSAHLCAARAAYLLDDGEAALRHAREAQATLSGAALEVDRLPQLTIAEAFYLGYTTRKTAEEPQDPEAMRALFLEVENALTSLLGRAPADPWVHSTLAYLYEWEGRLADARDALMRGVDRVPDAAGMVERLVDLGRRIDPERGALTTLEELIRRHPDLALARYHAGRERFDAALAALEKGDYQPDAFRAAEADFARCRALDPTTEDACTAYEVVCRNALGWCLYQEGDVEGAEAAFRSMEDVRERGLEWKIEGRLLDGVDGLAFCADAYAREGRLLRAAEVHDFLRGFRPDVTFANNAGFFLRDAAVEQEHQGRRLCEAARGGIASAEALAALRAQAGIDAAPGSDEERAAFREAAESAMARARELIRRSADAYRQACELAPDDVRIQNDAALVLMYYVHEDLDRAKAMLERCVELGTQKLQDEGLDEDARFELKSALGDAHQNLGVFLCIYEKDREGARAQFEKSLEVDREGRADVTGFWLPWMAGEIADSAALDDAQAILEWAAPCA